MKKLILIGLLLPLCLINSYAQVAPGTFGVYQEALSFSQTYSGGSARMLGIGGAQIALGGDISSAHANPAGLGFFNKSVATITPALDFHNSEINFLGSRTSDFRTTFNIANLGVVFNKSAGDIVDKPYKGGSFAISMTRVADYNNEFRYDAYNDMNSIIDFFLEQADGVPLSQIESNFGTLTLAYNNYLINPVYDTGGNVINGAYDSFVLGFPRQEERVKTSGAQYQWDFAYGGNYNDILYFGASLGITSVNYKRERTYIESAFELSDGTPDDALNFLESTDVLDISGVGVNATFGVIVRPTDVVRLGFAFTTPTYQNLNEESFSDLFTAYNDFYFAPEDTVLGSLFSASEIVLSNYKLRTPLKLSVGAAFFVGKNGFLSADVDFINYSSAQLKSNDFSVTADNLTINNLYQAVINYRIGGEYRLDRFRLRAGYGFQADPYTDSDIDNSIQKISGGLGYRSGSYFADLAITQTSFEDNYSPYTLSNGEQPIAQIDNSAINVAFTFGFNF